MQRTHSRRHRSTLVAGAIALAAVGASRPAAAEILVRVDGAANLGYSETTASPQSSFSRFSSDVHPALMLQFGAPQLAWRVGYAFSGDFTLQGTGPQTYSNHLELALAAELTRRTTIAVTGGATQGSSIFQLSQRAPEAGQPAFRAPGNPDEVTATLGQSLVWEASQQLRLGQSITGNVTAPQDTLGRYNADVTAAVRLERLFPNDAIGAEFRPSVAVLRPLTVDGKHYLNITAPVLATWNHDFDWRWNGQVTAGVEEVATLTGSYPLAIVPTGSLTARYLGQRTSGSLSFTHGALTDLQTGTVAMSDAVTVRGVLSFDAVLPRQLGASAGFLHSERLGEATARTAAGVGNALQGDVGFVWGLSESILATARYSIAYQFDQPGLEPSLAHVFLVGFTARWSNAPYVPPMPSSGGRVDGSDSVGFSRGDARP